MNIIRIKEPIWKNRSVGIDSEKIGPILTVMIDYKDKEGALVFPHTYRMKGLVARTYPTMKIKGHDLHIIPIKDFTYETVCPE